MIVDDLFESGAFTYGAKKPRKGSVADLAAQKRKEQEKDKQPVEPRDQMVGTARVTKDVAEDADLTKFTDYDVWSDKVDALGARKHMQKNGTLIVAQTWDGDVVGEFDTRSNHGHLKNQGVAEGADEGLSKYSTERLQAYVKKVSGGGVPAFGSGAKLKRVQQELKRREQGVAEGFNDLDRFMKDKYGPQPRGGSGIKTGTYGSPRRKRGRPTGAESLSGGSDIPHAVDFDRPHSERSAGRKLPRFSDDYDAIKRSEVDEGSAQDKLYKRHQELRKKSGLPDAEYYQELKQTYTLPDEERYAKQAEIKRRYGVKEQRTQCPECGGAAYEDQVLAEKNDACYHKVKSRYKVWPSAYASGALVRCRKVGAANWGNKSKK